MDGEYSVIDIKLYVKQDIISMFIEAVRTLMFMGPCIIFIVE